MPPTSGIALPILGDAVDADVFENNDHAWVVLRDTVADRLGNNASQRAYPVDLFQHGFENPTLFFRRNGRLLSEPTHGFPPWFACYGMSSHEDSQRIDSTNTPGGRIVLYNVAI